MKIDISKILSSPKEQIGFVREYIGMIESFRGYIYSYEFCTNPNDTPIKNTDLWIESRIKLIPELSEFRKFVHSEMERLKIKKHSALIYTPENNHYVYSDERKIKELKESLNL